MKSYACGAEGGICGVKTFFNPLACSFSIKPKTSQSFININCIYSYMLT
jgi:hypothetical protein